MAGQAIAVRRGHHQQQLPISAIDDKTQAKLRDLRNRVPRYLFRAWKNEGPKMSGGYPRLNSTEGIIPLAFLAGRGHSSVCQMTKSELNKMVLSHLQYDKEGFYTEFSSWTASLSYALLFYAGEYEEDVYISVIDTHALRHHNDVFFVPDLACLTSIQANRNKIRRMHHEYLVHGPVRGIAHKAVPFSAFVKAGFDIDMLLKASMKSKNYVPTRMTADEIHRAAQVGVEYGYQLAAPVALALLSIELRSPDLLLQEGSVEMNLLLKLLSNLHIPPSWSRDDTIMEDVVYFGNYLDVRQFIHLMRAVARRQILRVAGRSDATNRLQCNTPTDNCDRPGYAGVPKAFKLANDHQTTFSGRQRPYKWFIRLNLGKATIVMRSERKTPLRSRETQCNIRVDKAYRPRIKLKIKTEVL